MVADRQLFEDNAKLCGTGDVWRCFFAHQRGKEDGILVVPVDDCYDKYAAYRSENA